MNSFDKNILGEAPELKAILRSAQIIAATDVTVMLQGESGTGKELLARAIHNESQRHDAPFIAINCAALPESLAESELFGHGKGAFTGADAHNMGRIHAASGGTLFLDEVAELPLNVQSKLLRFLESGECQRLGETSTQRVDTRIISATHIDLLKRVEAGTFRDDLYYRLNVVPLEIPPLRERSGDIRMLLGALTVQLATQYQLSVPTYSKEAMAKLESYNWPGNVRELRNLCERMLILMAGKKIDIDNLPAEIKASQQSRQPGNIFEIPDEGIRLDEVEQVLINNALSKANGNRSKAARLLGLTRDTLLYRIKKYAIN
ncbi:MAG: sigma-54 dependent transcriptional regulator [Gammaproteobacteria bacterium]|nr:sigma-54 dependent transcriptional regulator [Gammaproteobacteria bacterium]